MLNKIKEFLGTNKLSKDETIIFKKLLPLVKKKKISEKNLGLFNNKEINNGKELISLMKKFIKFEEIKDDVNKDNNKTKNITEDKAKDNKDNKDNKTEDKIKEEEDSNMEKNLLNKFNLKEKDLILCNEGQELKALIEMEGGGEEPKKVKVKEGTKFEVKNELDEVIANFIKKIFNEAILAKAADIHIEPKIYEDGGVIKNYGRVRFNENGDILDKPELSFRGSEIGFDSLVTKVCELGKSNMDKAKKVPLDFKIDYIYKVPETGESRLIDLRVSTMPADPNSVDLVIRILGNFPIPEISSLGLRGPQLDIFKLAIKSKEGIVLVVGPTGSGKSVTQSSIVKELSKNTKIKIISGESPVENKENAIVQSAIVTQNFSNADESEIYDFKKYLKSALRHAPNIIQVQELRDKDDVEIAIEAALTGHLVTSTYHANSSAETTTRMLYMGVPKIMIASSFKLILSQRLLKKHCTKCATTGKLNEEQIGIMRKYLEGQKCLEEEYKFDHRATLVGIEDRDDFPTINEKGCENCRHRGVVGRQGVFELMLFNKKLLEDFTREESTFLTLEKTAQDENGMATLKQDALIRVLKGELSFNEADEKLNFRFD